MVTRADSIRRMAPNLIADLSLYPPQGHGRATPAYPGWGCPCCISKTEPIVGYDGWPQLGDEPLAPGATRRLGFVFLGGDEAAQLMRHAGKFYLWEGHFIGEAIVVV